MRLEHHLVGGYVRYISPHIIIIINVQIQSGSMKPKQCGMALFPNHPGFAP